MVWLGGLSGNPCLYRMAMDHLSIPGDFFFCLQMYLLTTNITATSVDVEPTFSQGQLVLLPVCSHLSVQSTRALLCLTGWSKKGLVSDDNMKSAAVSPEVDGEEE